MREILLPWTGSISCGNCKTERDVHDFVMTALFVVMFIDQWEDAQDHKPALVGIVCSVICLVIFGSGKFILPSMASIVLCFLGMKKHEEKRKKERIQKSGEYQA